MTFGPEDPRLTAYLLDELSPQDRQELDKVLEEDPALRATLAELEASLNLLRSALRPEDSTGLEPGRVQAILASGPAARPRWWLPSSIAALLALGFGLLHVLQDAPPQPAASPEEPAPRLDEVQKLDVLVNGVEDTPAPSAPASTITAAPSGPPAPVQRLRVAEVEAAGERSQALSRRVRDTMPEVESRLDKAVDENRPAPVTLGFAAFAADQMVDTDATNLVVGGVVSNQAIRIEAAEALQSPGDPSGQDF